MQVFYSTRNNLKPPKSLCDNNLDQRVRIITRKYHALFLHLLGENLMNKSVLRSTCLLFGILVCFLLPAIALAQPVFKDIFQGYVEDNDRILLDTPVGTSVGDFMLVQISLSDNEEIESIPSGWTELLDFSNSNVRVWLGYKFVTPADITASYRWDIAWDADIVGQLRVYRNVDPKNPINAMSRDDNDTIDIDSFSVTTTLDNTMIVRMFGAEYPNVPEDLSPSQNNEYFQTACYCVDTGVVQGSGDRPQALAGNSGTATWDREVSEYDAWISVTVALAENPKLATFQVTKNFIPDSSMPVEVSIVCNDGLPLDSSQVITEDTGGVTFIVELFTPGNLNCEITEVPVPTGYDDSYSADTVDGFAGLIDNVDGCQFENVFGGDFSCAIDNTAQDATYEVNKVWEIISEGGDLIPQDFHLTLSCNQEIVAASPGSDFSLELSEGSTGEVGLIYIGPPNGVRTVTWMDLTGNATVWVDVDSTSGPASCSAQERVFTSAVEVDNPCSSPQGLTMGQTATCTITNTVFYEGIPALNRYGLAIMVLLMLGVGFVGFRRFV